jgi:hypothetical protein
MKSLMQFALVAQLLMVQIAWSQTTQPATISSPRSPTSRDT